MNEEKKGKNGRLFNKQVSNKYHFSFPLLSSFPPPFQNKNTLQNKKKNKKIKILTMYFC